LLLIIVFFNGGPKLIKSVEAMKHQIRLKY